MAEPQNQTNIEGIGYFVRFFKPYWFYISLSIFLLILSSLASVYEPIALKNIIDWLTIRAGLNSLAQLTLIYFATKLLVIVFDVLRDYFWSPVIYSVSRDIEKNVYRHLLDLPIMYHADQKSGTAVRAMIRGSSAVALILDVTITRLVPPFFQLLLVTVILYRFYSWQFSAITFFSIAAYTWYIIWSNERRIKYRLEGNLQDDAASGVLVDSITNIETVKYFNNDSTMYNQWQKIKENWNQLMTRNNRLFAFNFGTQSFILLVGLGLILVSAINQTNLGIITIGSLILLSTYIIGLSGPIAILGFVYGQFKNSFADLNAMVGILNQQVTLKEPDKPETIKQPKGEVEFTDVTFAYPGRPKVLDRVSFVIKPGEKAAFVGPSGAGKSTIAKLVFRLFDVTSGEIKIDGVPLGRLSRETRKKILAIVPQEPALFNDSLENNIKFSQPDATKSEIISAAKAAQIHDFIVSIPETYDTKVGERGMKISGGQKQRVAIARAILKNPKILVFDEATSSLDSKSEQAILKTLDSVSKGRTTIAIAHRLSTIVTFNRIYVLDDGRIAEVGTHHELLKNKGIYATMWRLQSDFHQSQTNPPVETSDNE